jgi:hypothetical protein
MLRAAKGGVLPAETLSECLVVHWLVEPASGVERGPERQVKNS